jgi:hypothetical protein
MSLALLFHYLILNLLRMLAHPSSWACDIFVELFHEITQQISRKLLRMDVLTFETYWALNNEIIKQVTSSCSVFIQISTHEITQQISRKLLRMDVLTYETCWALNNEIIKQVTSGWSIFIQQSVLFKIRLNFWSTVATTCTKCCDTHKIWIFGLKVYVLSRHYIAFGLC